MLSHTLFYRSLLAGAVLLFSLTGHAQVTLGFQGAEPGDPWGYVSTGADPVAQGQAVLSPNIVTGTASLVVGGNTPGGNCFDVGTGNGPSTARTFTFDNLNISSSDFFNRTLQFNWGNRFPVCVGTGWDSGENLVFTAFHDGVAQPSVTLATGVNNATFNINANQYTWNIPPCVDDFYFRITITTNRRDELLFLDDVKLTAPALNSPLLQPSPVVGDISVCQGAVETYSVTQVAGLIYTWSGLPAGASFTTPNGTTGAYTIGINWGAAATGTYVLSVTPSEPCGTSGPPQTVSVMVTAPIAVSITPSGPTTFCAGGSVTLTSSESSGNTWSTGSTANAITVTTSGTYTVTVASGCGPVSASVTVTVNPSPTAVITPSGPTTFCAGGSVTLTSNAASGNSWSTGSTANAITVTTSGTYTLTVTDACGTASASQTVTVTAGTTASITPSGPTTFCAGGSVTLTSSAASGNSWSTGSTANAITVTTSGTYTLTVTDGCGTASASETVTVNPLPTVLVNNATTCPGVPATLTASGALTYTWSPATGLSATTGNSVSATPLSTTSYVVTGTDAATCSNSATATVTVNPFANATITPQAALCTNTAPVILTAVEAGGTWTSSCGTCINASTGEFDPGAAGTGTHTVTYTIAGSCGDTSTISIDVNPVPDVTATPQTICSGQTTSMGLSSAVAGTSFSWTVSAINVSGAFDDTGATIAQSLSTIVAPSGTVTYTITPSAAGCIGTALNLTVTVEDVSIDNITVVPVSCNGMNDGTITIAATGATQYSIDGGTSFQASPVFTAGPGTYTIVVENALGCNESTTATVTEPAVLSVNLSGTDETCLGSCNGTATAAVLGGTTPYTYSWSNGAGNFAGISALCTGNYVVTVTDSSGCTQSDTVSIGSLAGVSIDSVVVTDVLCNGGNTGTIAVYTTPAASQFSIDGGTSFQPSGNFSSLAAGTYPIVAQHASGCQANDTVVVNEPAALVLAISPDVVLCPGMSTTISASATGGTAPYTFTWDHGLPTGNSHVVNPAATDAYGVFVTDSNGCVSSPDVITVTVPAALTATASPDQTICPGASTLISVVTAGGLAPYTITWTNNLNAVVLSGTDQLVSPAAPALYTVTVEDNCGTQAIDTVRIDFHPLPQVSYTVDTGRGCLPLVVNFTSTTALAPGDALSWDFVDGSSDTGAVAQHVFGTAGCYDVTLQVTTAQGCVNDTTVINSVCVYALPLADFTFTPVPADVFEPEVDFVNLSLDAVAYAWDFAGLDASQLTNPSFIFPTDSAGKYQVCLTATSSAGCLDTACHWVEIEGHVTIYVPNAFTPDGDGTNDFFFPVCADIARENFTVLVFNRWGQVVYENHDPLGKWDGMQNGLRCKEDTYVWKVKYQENTTGVMKEVVGQVSLLR